MRVHQPGSHLTDRRGAAGRRLELGAHGAAHRRARPPRKPYTPRARSRSRLLLAAIATSLAPPYLAKLAIDDGIREGDLTFLGWVVVARSSSRRPPQLGRDGACRPTTRAGSASGSSPTCARVSSAHLQRLSLGYYERNRAGASSRA